jgi:hypothetical protein
MPCAKGIRVCEFRYLSLKGFTMSRPRPTFPRMSTCASLLGATLACALWSPAAQAYRPFDGTDAAVAEKGIFELELGAVRIHQGSEREFAAPAFTANYGIAENTELVFDGRLNRLLGDTDQPRMSFGDAALSVKHVFREGSLQEKAGPSVAAECGVLLPGIRGDAGTGATCAGIVSQHIDAVALHLNAGLTRTREKYNARYLGAIVEGPDEWALRPVMEVGTERTSEGGRTHSALLGLIWNARKDLTLDLGLRRAHGTEEPATEVRFGLTWNVRI